MTETTRKMGNSLGRCDMIAKSRRRFRARFAHALAIALGCVTGSIVATASPAAAVVSVRVMTSDAVPGGPVPLILSVSREPEDGSIASAQVDVIFQLGQLGLNGACSGDGSPCETASDCPSGTCQLLCEKAGRLEVQDFNATLPEFQNVSPGERRVRLRVLAPIQVELPLPTFEDGIVAMCMFEVRADAALGPIELRADRLEVGDEESNPIPAVVVIDAGSIVGSLPTPTATETQTPTPSPEQTPTEVPTPEPTEITEPTETPEPTEVPTMTPSSTPTTALTPATPTASPTATNTTPSVEPTATPTATTPIATQTATTVPTNTPTTVITVPATATPTGSVTQSPSGKRNDDDGCGIAAPSPDGRSQTWITWLLLPLGLLLFGRSHSRQRR